MFTTPRPATSIKGHETAASLRPPARACRDGPTRSIPPPEDRFAALGDVLKNLGLPFYQYKTLMKGIRARSITDFADAHSVPGRDRHAPAEKLGDKVIPVQVVSASVTADYRQPSATVVANFVRRLRASGVEVTRRRQVGAVIDAACGQLHGDYLARRQA